jgi:anti-sigma factor RsiW
MSCREFEPLVDSYFDGELPVTEALAAERHLSECAICRTRHKELKWLRSEIQTAGLVYTPPPSLIRRTRAVKHRGESSRLMWWWGAGLAAAAVVAILLVPRTLIQPDRAGHQILDSHLRSLLAANLVDVPSSDRHTVKPWFQGRLAFSPNVPDLSQDGFVLTGGRLEIINQQRAAALVYKRREHVINLFIVEGSYGAPDGPGQARGYNLIFWSDRGLSYAAVSDLNAPELASFVKLIRTRP